MSVLMSEMRTRAEPSLCGMGSLGSHGGGKNVRFCCCYNLSIRIREHQLGATSNLICWSRLPKSLPFWLRFSCHESRYLMCGHLGQRLGVQGNELPRRQRQKWTRDCARLESISDFGVSLFLSRACDSAWGKFLKCSQPCSGGKRQPPLPRGIKQHTLRGGWL